MTGPRRPRTSEPALGGILPVWVPQAQVRGTATPFDSGVRKSRGAGLGGPPAKPSWAGSLRGRWEFKAGLKEPASPALPPTRVRC